MDRPRDETMRFRFSKGDSEVQEAIFHVHRALKEKGYDPVNQLVGYLLSGDPTYITNHAGARSVMRAFERDQVLEELVAAYLAGAWRHEDGA